MTSITVITLNGVRMGFANDMPLWRQNLGEGVPIIRVKSTVCQVFAFVVEPPESCSITTAGHPGHSSPCATVKGFDDPKLVFLFPMKCRISSNSIWVISPDTSPSGSLAPASFIYR